MVSGLSQASVFCSLRLFGGRELVVGHADKKVLVQEVGPRDGLQNEPRTLSVEARIRLIEDLVDAGIPRVQIGSFVNLRRVPQMMGTDLVWLRLRRRPDTRYSVLILNRRGLELARAAGVPYVEIYVSASETHSLKNSGTSVRRALSEACLLIEEALKDGMGVTAGVMCALGCFYEGRVPVERVARLVAEFEEHGPAEIGLADTTGMGEPDAVKRVIQSLAETTVPSRLSIHLHDTRGFGMANLVAALELGVRRFDASIGGLGGCPSIPGAAGNISTEAAVVSLHRLGYPTGIDLDKLRSVTKGLESLVGRPLTSGRIVGRSA
jgi:hydroxymethylglutaryl-CoA lyase